MADTVTVIPILDPTIAKHLYFQGTASHRDVCSALGLSDEGGPGSLGLALIRSGVAPSSLR